MNRTYLILFLFFLFSSSLYAGNGLLIHGYGKNASMGGAGIAHPQDALTATVNPAGSVWVGNRVDFTNDVYYLKGGYKISNTNKNPADAGNIFQTLGVIGEGHEVESVKSRLKFLDLPAFGIVTKINDKLSLGMALYGTGLAVRYDRDDTTEIFPNNFLGKTLNGTFFDGTTAVELQNVNTNWHASYKVMDNISVGAGLNLVGQSFRAKGVTALKLVSQGEIAEWDRDITFGYGFNFGAQAEIIPHMRVAAAYHSKVKLEHDKYDGLFYNGDLSLPAHWTIGMSVDLNENNTFNFDVQKIYWSDLVTTGNKFTDIFNPNIDFSKPLQFQTNFLINPFGSRDNAGFGFSNSTVYKLGYQFKLDALPDWTWRMGYSYQKQIVPSNGTLFAVLSPGTIKTHFTFGFSKTFWKDYEGSFTLMYTGKEAVTGKGLNAGVDIYMEQLALGFGLGMKW